jgi:PIN domain nuclease of toxin-antitoxin system
MRLLLDTHTLLWLDGQPERLSSAATDAIANPDNTLLLSVVSAWEIQIKRQLGRLNLRLPLEDIVAVQQADNNVMVLPVELVHVYALEGLPPHHNDPFDRLLIAQARAEDAVLVTADRAIGAYADYAKLLW